MKGTTSWKGQNRSSSRRPFSKSKRTAKTSSEVSTSSRSDSKPRGVSKSKAKTKTQSKSKRASKQPFRFLDLPTELRASVYQFVLQDEPKAYLSTRSRGTLITQSALSRTNRQVRSEFLSAAYIYTPQIKAYVKNFDFQHIVTFLNRLSEREMEVLIEGPTSREIIIELSIDRKFLENEFGPDMTLFSRWINRLAHPTKKGTKILTEYAMAPNHPTVHAFGLVKLGYCQDFDREQRMHEEVLKIRAVADEVMAPNRW